MGLQSARLVDHFIANTSRTLAILEDSYWVWENEVPRLALQDSFIREGISALAALHLSHLQPDPKAHYTLARQHHGQAIHHFRMAAREISQKNCVALFAFSFIVAVFQLKVSSDRINEAGLSLGSAALFHSVDALRGGLALFKPLQPLLIKSNVASLIATPKYSFDQPVGETTWSALEELTSLNASSADNPKHRAVCAQAIASLREWFQMVGGKPKTWFHLFWWPGAVPREYLSLLHDSHPFALIVFLYWCVGIKNGFQPWFLEGYPENAACIIRRSLGSEWSEALRWPLAELQMPV
jgi:hypothetical protein